MFKRFLSLLLCVALFLPLLSCGTTPAPADENNPPVDLPEKNAIPLTDQAGRVVVLNEPAKTVVSVWHNATTILLSLGLTDRILGVESDAANHPIYEFAAPELLKKPTVGSLRECKTNTIITLNPSLVLLPERHADQADVLAARGIPSLVLSTDSREEMMEAVSLIAAAFGVSDRADALKAYYDTKLAEIASYTTAEEKPRVYYSSPQSYFNTCPAGSPQDAALKEAGGTSVSSDLTGDNWVTVTPDQLMAYNPELIVVPASAGYAPSDFYCDSQLIELDAVTHSRVYQIPNQIEDWDLFIPANILSTLWLTLVFSDGAYSQDAFFADCRTFYETFYGFTPDTSLLFW